MNQSTPQKLAQEVSTSDEKCDKSFAYQSYVETIKDVLLLEKGDVEDWRCVLPLGTVVCYKNNKNIQVVTILHYYINSFLNKLQYFHNFLFLNFFKFICQCIKRLCAKMAM